MAVVGEMHVGMGREEKEKRKGRGSKGTHLACDRRYVVREMRMPLARVARRLAEGSQARVSCAQAGTQLPRASLASLARLSHQEAVPLGACTTNRCCLLVRRAPRVTQNGFSMRTFSGI